MNQAMADDVHEQVEAFVQQLRSAFEPGRYPRLSDGASFDSALAILDAEFVALQRVFHDYLLASWSEETAAALRGMTDGAAGRPEGGILGERGR